MDLCAVCCATCPFPGMKGGSATKILLETIFSTALSSPAVPLSSALTLTSSVTTALATFETAVRSAYLQARLTVT